MPKASIVTLKDGPPANAQEVGVPSEQESAWTWQNPTGQTIHSNLPTPYWLNARIKHTLRMGVGAVAFWHLGCHEASQICQMADQTSGQTFAAPAHNTDSWDEQLEPWKRRVCTIYTAKTGDTFESIASATGIKRFTLIRFNESLYGKDLAGREVFVPSK